MLTQFWMRTDDAQGLTEGDVILQPEYHAAGGGTLLGGRRLSALTVAAAQLGSCSCRTGAGEPAPAAVPDRAPDRELGWA